VFEPDWNSKNSLAEPKKGPEGQKGEVLETNRCGYSYKVKVRLLLLVYIGISQTSFCDPIETPKTALQDTKRAKKAPNGAELETKR